MSASHPKSPKFSSLAPSALASHFYTFLGGGRAQKQGIREPVRLTLCSFERYTVTLEALRAIFGVYHCILLSFLSLVC